MRNIYYHVIYDYNFSLKVADALKLLVKEIIIPRQSNNLLFVMGPCITLIFALLGWAIIPFGEGLAIFDYELGIFFALAVSSLGSYGILISGWAANSKYTFMGAIRSTAQLLSYELIFSSIILILILFSGSFSLTYIVECQQIVWNIFPLLPIALMFFIAILAETNRPPFDLSEAESELVAGLCGMRFILYCWSWKTLSWVLGLIQYKSNDWTSVIGIVSNLYWKFIEYVNKLMNPYKGSLYHEIIVIGNKILLLFTHFYTWTSKIMDPTERLTPCIDTIWVKRNETFLKESGSSIFRYNVYNYTNSKGETITRSGIWKIVALEKGGKWEIFQRRLIKNFSTCSPTTKKMKEKINTQFKEKIISEIGINFSELININQNNDGKFRKISSYLFNPSYLIEVYNKLNKLGIINYNIEFNWFEKTAIEIKKGSYNPSFRYNDIILNKENNITRELSIYNDNKKLYHLNDIIINEAICIILIYIFKIKNVMNSNIFPSFEFDIPTNKCMHTCLLKLKTEWNDINWILNFNFNDKFELIHRKIIFSELEKYIDDQRLFDILNKLFNLKVCNLWYKKTFNKYDLWYFDKLSFLLVNIFFHRFDMNVYKIKHELFKEDNGRNISNIRYIRYFNEILIGVKGSKEEALNIKRKIEIFLESDLHLKILNKKTNIIHISSDKIFNFNVNISNTIKDDLSLNNKRSKVIQQRKKGIKLRNIKAMKYHKNIQANTIKTNVTNSISKKSDCIPISVRKAKESVENGINKKKESLNIKMPIKVNYRININADLSKIKKILINTGLLNKKNKPRALTNILNWDAYHIISFYRQISKLIWNTFSVCDNYKSVFTIIDYHIKWSLLHTLAAKHKCRIKKILNVIYPELKVSMNDKLIIFYSKNELLKSKINLFTYKQKYLNMDINWNDISQNFFEILKQDMNIIVTNNSRINVFSNAKRKSYPLLEKDRLSNNNLVKLGLNRKYINNKMNILNCNNKRYISINVKRNNINGLFHNDNTDRKQELNLEYLINLYPFFLDEIKDNKGQFWSGDNKDDLNDKEFKEWFSGFVDAEGLFFIKLRKNYNTCSFNFELHIHLDDLPVLKYIQKRLNIGKIRTLKKAAWFYVNKLNEIEYLISIFDEYPLWTHKQLDYNSFKLGFINRNNYSLIIDIKNNMNSKRTNYDNYILPHYLKLAPYWLIGFVEGDGCFTMSKMKAHFYLTQKNNEILNVIRDYFLTMINKDQILTNNNVIKNKNNYSLSVARKKKNINPVYSFSITNQDIIYKYIVPFFARRKLLTRKGYDFYIWLICVNIIIFGYSKLKEGKILLLLFSKNMNNKRYSKLDEVKNKYVYSLNFDYSSLFNSLKLLFSRKPIFNLTDEKSHKELSNIYNKNELKKNFKSKLGRSVFAYKCDNYSLINNVPYSSIKEASKILNIPESNISNYIDTDIEIKGYYFFSEKKEKK